MSESFDVDDNLTSSYTTPNNNQNNQNITANETVSTTTFKLLNEIHDTYTDEGEDGNEGHQRQHEPPIDYPLDSVLDTEVGIRFEADGFLRAATGALLATSAEEALLHLNMLVQGVLQHLLILGTATLLRYLALLISCVAPDRIHLFVVDRATLIGKFSQLDGPFLALGTNNYLCLCHPCVWVCLCWYALKVLSIIYYFNDTH